MNPSEARDLFAYDEWANGRMFRVLDGLSAEQFAKPVASSFASLQDTVGHIVAVEWVWLRRWKGQSPTAPPPWVTGATGDTLRQALAEVQEERALFLADLTDERLEQLVVYRNLKGEEYRQRLGVLLQHLVNHSTYHRGQVATLLRQVGVVPSVTDYVVYRIELG
jgi:uncharacterized damage-inducible protein DinB